MSGMAHFFMSVGGSKFHERLAHFFIDIYTFLSLLLEFPLFYKECDVSGKLFQCHCGQVLE